MPPPSPPSLAHCACLQITETRAQLKEHVAKLRSTIKINAHTEKVRYCHRVALQFCPPFKCTVNIETLTTHNSPLEYLVYSIKRLPTPKVNKLRSPKLRLTQPLLVATFTQNFMRFRCTVMEKRHQNISPHNSVCDDLYHACTLAWGKLCALFTPH